MKRLKHIPDEKLSPFMLRIRKMWSIRIDEEAGEDVEAFRKACNTVIREFRKFNLIINFWTALMLFLIALYSRYIVDNRGMFVWGLVMGTTGFTIGLVTALFTKLFEITFNHRLDRYEKQREEDKKQKEVEDAKKEENGSRSTEERNKEERNNTGR